MHTNITEYDAVQDIITAIQSYKTKHGVKALKDAITAGAFNIHSDYGDITYVFKEKEYDHDQINIPLWIHDLYSDLEEIYS